MMKNSAKQTISEIPAKILEILKLQKPTTKIQESLNRKIITKKREIEK